MSMYEARQNKEKVSRRIDSTRTIQGLILQRHLKIKNPETEDVKSYIKMQTAETAPNIYSILMNMIDSEKEYTFNTIKDAIDNVCQMFGTYSTIDDILLKKEESINGVNEVNNLSNHYKNMIMKSVEEHKNEKNIFGFRGDLSEILAAAKKENQGNKILTNIECVIKRQRFNSISDFQNQICSDYGYKDYTSFRQMNNTNDSQKTIKSIESELNLLKSYREGSDGLWESKGEIDVAVVDTTQKDSPTIVEIQQVKSGRQDKHENAANQNVKIKDFLMKMKLEKNNYHLFEKSSHTKLGKDITNDYNISDNLKTSTIGPKDKKGFNESLELTVDELTDLAQYIIKEYDFFKEYGIL